ncbi:MAG: aconitase X [Bacillota bacterium]
MNSGLLSRFTEFSKGKADCGKRCGQTGKMGAQGRWYRVILSSQERDMLEGKFGEGARLAMQVVTEVGQLYGAERLVAVSQVHIDGCLYGAVGDAGLEFAEKLAAVGAKVRVPTTLNVTSRDIERWREFRIPEDFSEKSRRMEKAYLAMGCIPTWTCAPYQVGIVPRFGEQIAWAESNAICFANSVLGARTNRYADLVDICCAVVGKAPYFGLHIAANRRSQVLIEFDLSCREILTNDRAYSAAGYLVGEIAGSRIPAILGIPHDVSTDHLKVFSAAAASSGAVGLVHIVGVTPEARTLDEAFHGGVPEETVKVDRAALEDACRRLDRPSLAPGARISVDVIMMGCPHASYSEICSVVSAMGDRKVKPGVEFWIQTSKACYDLLERSGVLEKAERAGIKLLRDSCMLEFPLEEWGFSTLVTNSGKAAHYAPGHVGLDTYLRDTLGCVEAAVTGEVASWIP